MDHKSPNIFAHLQSILALPFVVIIVIPSLIYFGVEKKLFNLFHLIDPEIIDFFGGFFLVVGLFLMIRTILLFSIRGKGTLAPWDPPKKLVVKGPYRFVRNPMLVGVNFLLLSLGCLLRNENILLWMMIFTFFNTIYFIKKEEPDLEKRFGEDYVEYKKNVPRWIPRLTAWENQN